MRGKKARYTFVIEFLGGTYVHQGSGESPELALRAFLRVASEEDEWTAHRVELIRSLADEMAAPVEGCENVWCLSGIAGDYLYLIHIIATESGSGAGGKAVAEAEVQQIGADPKRWGLGDRW